MTLSGRTARSIEPIGARHAPLSPAQEGLLTIHRLLGPDASRLLNCSAAVRVRGPLDVELLGRAATAVVARHETLRTSYELDGERGQTVADPWPVEVRATEVRAGDTVAALDEAIDVVRAAATAPFDLSVPRPLRLDAVRLAHDDHVVGLAIDHMASDPPSLGLFLTEALTACAGLRDGGALPALPPLPIQYGDYARWQRARSDDPRRSAEHRAYWSRQLDGLASLPLPFGVERTGAWETRGHHLRFAVDGSVRAELVRQAASQRTTLFAAVLAVIGRALARACDTDEVTLATLPAHRPHRACRHVIGLFANLTLLRLTGLRDAAWPVAVAAAREAAMGALTHGELPFGQLVQVPGVLQLLDRSRSFWPLVHVVDDLGARLAGRGRAVAWPGLSVTPLDGSAGGDRDAQPMLPVDVHLVVRDRGDHLLAELRCNAGAFDPGSAGRLRQALERSLRAAAAATRAG